MRVDGDAALRTRQAANTAARDSPNILAWGSVDVLLDALGARQARVLAGPVRKEPGGYFERLVVRLSRQVHGSEARVPALFPCIM